MKFAHLIRVRVFAKNNEEKILNSFLSFFPFDLEKEKLAVNKTAVEGFGHKQIRVFELTLTKEKHTTKFLKSLIGRLDEKQKGIILNQLESRIDSELNLFLRFDEDRMVNEGILLLTDGGNCFHIKISVAAFPANKEKAVETIKLLFIGN